MNIDRIICVMNYFFQLSGYQLHWFDRKSRRFRLTIFSIVNFIFIAFFYAICLNQHFEKSSLLKLLADVSPFLSNLMHIHLFLCLKIMIYSVYELRFITQATNTLLEVMPKIYAKQFCKDEAFAYCLLFSTLLISFGLVLYIAYEMQFKLPPFDHILICSALFIPHFSLACALKLYNIGNWLFLQVIQDLSDEFARVFETNKVFVAANELKEVHVMETTPTDLSVEQVDMENFDQPLLEICNKMEQLLKTQAGFNMTLQNELSLLVALNNNCILFGIYALVYFESEWHVIFMERSKRVFLAANYGIYTLIFWDYLCFCLTNEMYTKMKSKFIANVEVILKLRFQYSKRTRSLLKDLYRHLTEKLEIKIFRVSCSKTVNFLSMQVIIGLVMALIIMYNYLNDQIKLLNARLEDNSLED